MIGFFMPFDFFLGRKIAAGEEESKSGDLNHAFI